MISEDAQVTGSVYGVYRYASTSILSGNTVTLVLSSLSQLTGDVINSGALTLSDEQCVTAYIDASLTNSGEVILNRTSTSAGNTLIITGEYVGETRSSLSVGAILAGDGLLTDKVSILSNTSGSNTVYIANENGSGGQTLEGICIIAVGGNSNAVFAQGNRAVAGLYDYSLIKKGSNWYMTSYVTPTEPVTPMDPTTPTDLTTPMDPIPPTSLTTPVGVVR